MRSNGSGGMSTTSSLVGNTTTSSVVSRPGSTQA